MKDNRYFVYIVASRSRNLYTGVTNDLERRVWEHRQGLIVGFTKKYRIHRLVYFEPYEDVHAAIEREKQIKAWRRSKRVALISRHNPAWDDFAADCHDKKVLEKSRSLAVRARKGSG